LVAGALAAPARAAEPTKAEIAVARQYFDAASAAENQGRWRDAIDQLDKAIAIKETAGLRYHLGFAKENLGMLVDAMLEYQRASGLVHSDTTSVDVERFIVPKLEEMRRRVPTLTVTLPPGAKGAHFQVDGAAVKPELFGNAIPLNPGTHALVVIAPGHRPFHTQITVTEGSAVTQAAELVPETGGSVSAPAAPFPAPWSGAPAEHPEPPVESPAGAAASRREPLRAAAEHPKGWNTRRGGTPEGVDHPKGWDFPGSSGSSAKTWVLIGEAAVTAAGLGIGVGYLAAARAAQTRVDEANSHIGSTTSNPCQNPPAMLVVDCQNVSTALSDRRRDHGIALAGLVGAGVGASALVATLILWKTPSQRRGLFVTPMSVTCDAGLMLGFAH
jgi:hypothetical protein